MAGPSDEHNDRARRGTVHDPDEEIEEHDRRDGWREGSLAFFNPRVLDSEGTGQCAACRRAQAQVASAAAPLQVAPAATLNATFLSTMLQGIKDIKLCQCLLSTSPLTRAEVPLLARETDVIAALMRLDRGVVQRLQPTPALGAPIPSMACTASDTTAADSSDAVSNSYTTGSGPTAAAPIATQHPTPLRVRATDEASKSSGGGSTTCALRSRFRVTEGTAGAESFRASELFELSSASRSNRLGSSATIALTASRESRKRCGAARGTLRRLMPEPSASVAGGAAMSS